MVKSDVKEVKRPTKEMQSAIAAQLGLEVSTVANFFMNARRRSLDKWLDDKDSACHTQGSPGSDATASTSSTSARASGPSTSASGAGGGGKSGREGRQKTNKRAAADVSVPASPSDSHTIDSPPPQPTRASQQSLQPSGSTSTAGVLTASFSSDMFGAKMGNVGSAGGGLVVPAAASLGSGMRSAIQSLALFQAGYEPAFGMAGAGALQPSPDPTLRYKSLDAQYAALQFGVGGGASNQNGPLCLGAASSKLMV